MAARRSTDFHMRLTPTELRVWRRAAKADDMPIAQWVRRLCNTAAAAKDLARTRSRKM